MDQGYFPTGCIHNNDNGDQGDGDDDDNDTQGDGDDNVIMVMGKVMMMVIKGLGEKSDFKIKTAPLGFGQEI